jgi:hypothetical protein
MSVPPSFIALGLQVATNSIPLTITTQLAGRCGMNHETEQPLEHVEHAQHAASNPFDRKVAMTMAIVAAVLACVALLSHREHTETVLLSTKAADQWSFYQAKKGRQHLYEGLADLLTGNSGDAKSESTKASLSKWQDNIERYKTEAEEIMNEAKRLHEESELSHHRADRFDLGELGVQLAIILCSIAVLTKRVAFWYGGIFFGIVGAAVAATGFLM